VGVKAPGNPIRRIDLFAEYSDISIFSGGNPLCSSTDGRLSPTLMPDAVPIKEAANASAGLNSMMIKIRQAKYSSPRDRS